MRVVVPTPEPDCAAHRALTVERVEHDVIPTSADPGCYADMWRHLWAVGEPWVNVEWDICPWPGAIAELAQCSEPWCAIPYPIGQADDLEDNCITGMGCMKVTPQTRSAQRTILRLDVPWDRLDGAVVPLLNQLYGQPHRHWPPVAHCRREPAA